MKLPERRPDWQARFAALCLARQHQPFAWGSHDCCLWAADAVQALTGLDFAAEHRGLYADAEGAARLLHRLGGVGSIAAAVLGAPVPVSRATVGDVLLLQQDGRKALGVCNGSAALAAGPQGLAVLGMDTALAAWKV